MILRNLRYAIRATLWKRLGRPSGGAGWNAAKWIAIRNAIASSRDGGYGYADPGIDERVVEYGWIFGRLRSLAADGQRILDAGSVLNHTAIIDHWRRTRLPPVSIFTLAYDGKAFVSDAVRYEFGDLRRLPYRDTLFSVVLCVSTLEHVGLDTSVYGAASEAGTTPTTEAIQAMREMLRVTKPGGTMLLSVPFGKASTRNWFRVFDQRELDLLIENSGWQHVGSRFFRATSDGWRECGPSDVAGAGYNEGAALGGIRTAPAFVAGAEAVALVELKRPA